MVLCIVSIMLFVNKKTVTQKGFDSVKSFV
jgi:hypothetical protein